LRILRISIVSGEEEMPGAEREEKSKEYDYEDEHEDEDERRITSGLDVA
jgi:hypothetical protein